MTLEEGQTTCNRCLRLGRTCITKQEGQACLPCRKSKVPCPFYDGVKKRGRSRATSRRSTRARSRLPSVSSDPASPSRAFASPPPSLPVPSSSKAPSVWAEASDPGRTFSKINTKKRPNAMSISLYTPPSPPPRPRKRAKAQPSLSPIPAPTKSSRGRSLSRPPARTPKLVSQPAPAKGRSRGRSDAGDRPPSAGPSTRKAPSDGKLLY